MTRSIKPQTDYQGHASYPAATPYHLSRRGFLQVTLAGSAATAAAVLLPGEAAGRKGGKRKRLRHRFYLHRAYYFRGGNYRLDRLEIYTHSAALVGFLQNPKEHAGLEKAVVKVLDRHTCEVALKGRKLARLEADLARALAAHYRRRTRRRVKRPSVMVLVGRPRAHCRGRCLPATPYCKPPR